MAASQSVSAILARTRMWAAAAAAAAAPKSGRDGWSFALFLSWKLFKLFKRVDMFENEKRDSCFFQSLPPPVFCSQFFWWEVKLTLI